MKIYDKFAVVRYDCIAITAVEAAVFIAPDADNLGLHWAVVDSDFCPWWEECNDDDYGDLIRVRPYVDVELRPNAASKRTAAPPEFTDSESDGHDSGSDTGSGHGSYESEGDCANDHGDADEDGVDIASLAQAP